MITRHNGAVRRLLPIVLLALVVASCGGGSMDAAPTGLAAASRRTVAGDTANFTLAIRGTVAGVSVRSSETGSLSFSDRHAHFYKLVPGGGLPPEIVLGGPWTYTNANVDAAPAASSVKPWTKLDTRKLPASDRKSHPDELTHVRAPAHPAGRGSDAKQGGVTSSDNAYLTKEFPNLDVSKTATIAK